MCMTGRPAELSDTFLYAGEAIRDGRMVHVIAYQNKASSRGPNAMILPIPSKSPMGPENIIDTRAYPDFLKEMSTLFQHDGIRRGVRSKSVALLSSRVQVFESGSYTVVLADNANSIPEALSQVAEKKRPSIGAELMSSISSIYPEWPVAVCCWAGTVKAEPLLWWYDPMDDTRLFAPSLDAHDGRGPTFGSVAVDHTVMFGIGDRLPNEKGNWSKIGTQLPLSSQDWPEQISSLIQPFV